MSAGPTQNISHSEREVETASFRSKIWRRKHQRQESVETTMPLGRGEDKRQPFLAVRHLYHTTTTTATTNNGTVDGTVNNQQHQPPKAAHYVGATLSS